MKAVNGKIDAKIVAHFDPLAFEKGTLYLLAAERKSGREPTESVDDAVTGIFDGLGIDVERVPDRAGRARRAERPGDIAVGRHFSAGNGDENLVHPFKKRFLIRRHDRVDIKV